MRHAVYPGSFDPLTNGHLDIIQRVARLFDQVTIAVLKNTSKKWLLSIEERVELIRQVIAPFSNVKAEPFDGLLADFCRKNDIHIIIRGLRTVTDYDYEQAIALMNRTLLPEAETIFLPADKEHSFTSSTIVKEVASLGGDVASQVPATVFKKLHKIYHKE